MTKKAAVLTSGLIATKGAAAPVSDMPTRSPATAKEKTAKTTPLNFKVTPEFAQRFKARAVADRLKLNELLEAVFEAYERSDGAR